MKIELQYSLYYISDEPIWKAHQRSIFYGFISGTSNLTCEADAEPAATFAWFDKRGKPIQEGAILTENQISTLVVSPKRNLSIYSL